ncbi:hypothetical protein Vretimale_16009 [Volvox reticuliferus]|uniref:Uncharacterized protein n=1 Tax=Volvox reticuliferus TaxID=1737510 RepID=A0A8J4GQ59_9CHLO|nr:hypothetical protein Vretifemale_9757 [Volvox reticuliferus]GIM12765.1 hypothetical protein Vretimale_16009 [Volvox reticuliferus]
MVMEDLASAYPSPQPPSADACRKNAATDTDLHLAVTSISDEDARAPTASSARKLVNVTQIPSCKHLPHGPVVGGENGPYVPTTCAAVSCGPCGEPHMGIMCGNGLRSQGTGCWPLHLLDRMGAAEVMAAQDTKSAATSIAQVARLQHQLQQARSLGPGPTAEGDGCPNAAVVFLDTLNVHPVLLEVLQELRIMRAEQMMRAAPAGLRHMETGIAGVAGRQGHQAQQHNMRQQWKDTTIESAEEREGCVDSNLGHGQALQSTGALRGEGQYTTKKGQRKPTSPGSPGGAATGLTRQ